MIFYYYGEDSYRAHQKIQAITEKFKSKIDIGAHNVVFLDGESISNEDFFNAVSSSGFLAEKKLIVVKNLPDNKTLKNWQDELIKYLQKLDDSPEENYIVFWITGNPDSRTKLHKALNKFKFVEEFKKLTPAQLNTWIRKEVEKNKRTISPEALNLLVEYVGNDLWQLSQEIGKLSNYSKDEISSQDVRTLVQAKIDDNIFTLVDALGDKDKAQALKLLEERINNGLSGQYILTMIVRQFRIIIKTKSLSKSVSSASGISQTLKLHPMVAGRALKQSKLYTEEDLLNIYNKLLELDEKFKSTSNQEKILFAQMINSL